MHVISDGTMGVMTSAIFVDRAEDLPAMVKLFIERTGVDPMYVTVNPVSPPVSGDLTDCR